MKAAKRSLFGALLLCLATSLAFADTSLSEGFDNVAGLSGSGWVMTNNSSPVGSTGWYQGDPFIFTANSGADDSYISANFLNAGFGGNVDNWLLTPVIHFNNWDSLTFVTRTEPGGDFFNDALNVWFNSTGSTSLGDFNVSMVSIPAGSLPEDWAAYQVYITGVGASGVDGRIGFEYHAENTAINGDVIGIDDVQVNKVPEPFTLVTLASGLAGAGFWRRKK